MNPYLSSWNAHAKAADNTPLTLVGSPVVDSTETVYVATVQGHIAVFKEGDEPIVWPADGVIADSLFIANDNHLYYATNTGIWKQPLTADENQPSILVVARAGISSMVLAPRETLSFFTCRIEELTCELIDKNGTMLFSAKLNGKPTKVPTLLANGSKFVVSTNSGVDLVSVTTGAVESVLTLSQINAQFVMQPTSLGDGRVFITVTGAGGLPARIESRNGASLEQVLSTTALAQKTGASSVFIGPTGIPYYVEGKQFKSLSPSGIATSIHETTALLRHVSVINQDGIAFVATALGTDSNVPAIIITIKNNEASSSQAVDKGAEIVGMAIGKRGRLIAALSNGRLMVFSTESN